MRICPNCRERTDEELCPHDGYKTVVAAAYDAPKGEAPGLVGTVFEGRYRVERQIGEGGFGSVYLATQLSVERSVALKVLRPELAADLTQVARFQREARAIASMAHPHIVSLIDFGQSEDQSLYLVMEYLEGTDLGNLLALEGPLPPPRIVDIAKQTLDALAYAHERGIIHRDLKPENLLLTTFGRREDHLKVVDFGIAKVEHPEEAKRGSITNSGMTIGSPRYISPEQALAKPVGPATDLYALGAILFELLTGRSVFDEESATALMVQHAREAPPWPTLAGKRVVGPLPELILRCLEKEPERRPQSAQEMFEILEAMGDEPAWLEDETHEMPGPQEAETTVFGPKSAAVAAARAAAQRRRELEALTTGLQGASVALEGPDCPIDTRDSDGPIAVPRSWGPMIAFVVVALGLVGLATWYLMQQPTSPAPQADAPRTESPARVAGADVSAATPSDVGPTAPADAGPTPEVGLSAGSLAGSALGKEAARVAAAEAVERAAGADAPRDLSVVIESSPRAAVFKGGNRVGRTPMRVHWKSDEPPPVLELRRQGRQTVPLDLKQEDAGKTRRYHLPKKALSFPGQ